MGALIVSAFAFPTVVFTVGVFLFLIYAALKVVGFSLSAVLDLFDFEFGDGEGHNFLDTLGVRGIPTTIVFGITSIIGWLASYIGMKYFGGDVSPWLVLIGALVIGFLGATVVLRPFRPFFASDAGASRAALVGRGCVIRSTRVDASHGSAEVDDGGAGVLAEVRCHRENNFTVGSKAVVQRYDPETGTYWVGDPSWT
ncbi:MAG TPA: hypothetical protein VFT12_01205 [Thermoanaerobaculia bacterium]|nr:hypothetical protein [Thermoanaerobaculia bacterium]